MVTLKQLRKGRGVSQTDLAGMLQDTRGGKGYQGPISAIESGRNSPTVKRLFDILDALGYELRITAKAKGEPQVTLDLGSLLGGPPRAKDAREEPLESDPGPPGSLPEPDPGPTQDAPPSGVEALILNILNK
jgi:transcriptional regulator with XRE-family HTH domain